MRRHHQSEPGSPEAPVASFNLGEALERPSWRKEQAPQDCEVACFRKSNRNPTIAKVRKQMAVGLPIFIVLVGKPEKPFVKLLYTKEALEGCKHEFTTSLSHEGRLQCLRTPSYRLTEVSDSVRGLCCWLASSRHTPVLWRTRRSERPEKGRGTSDPLVRSSGRIATNGQYSAWWSSRSVPSVLVSFGRSSAPITLIVWSCDACGRDFVCHPKE